MRSTSTPAPTSRLDAVLAAACGLIFAYLAGMIAVFADVRHGSRFVDRLPEPLEDVLVWLYADFVTGLRPQVSCSFF